MTPLVLRFKGLPERQSQALDRLRRTLPGVRLTQKTTSLVEAQVESERDELDLRALEDWEVSDASFAEISPPALNWQRLRSKLGS